MKGSVGGKTGLIISIVLVKHGKRFISKPKRSVFCCFLPGGIEGVASKELLRMVESPSSVEILIPSIQVKAQKRYGSDTCYNSQSSY